MQANVLRHWCDGVSCECGGERSKFIRLAVIALGDILSVVMPVKVPAANRWASVSPVLSALCFLILAASIGPAAWLHQWPLRAVHDPGPEADPSDWQVVNTKRLRK
eukprot:4168142-Alexandrium_andersonii.AAC.1